MSARPEAAWGVRLCGFYRSDRGPVIDMNFVRDSAADSARGRACLGLCVLGQLLYMDRTS
jgi:hypothetical protein